MQSFDTGREAKEYIIARIVDQARKDGVPLSDVERKMMYFSETAWTLPDIRDVNDVFEREYDQPAYEAKIGGLAWHAWGDAIDAEEDQTWKDAVQTLKSEDHYLLVLLDAGKPTTSDVMADKVKLLLTAILVVALLLIGVAIFSNM